MAELGPVGGAAGGRGSGDSDFIFPRRLVDRLLGHIPVVLLLPAEDEIPDGRVVEPELETRVDVTSSTQILEAHPLVVEPERERISDRVA